MAFPVKRISIYAKSTAMISARHLSSAAKPQEVRASVDADALTRWIGSI
jgi:hypothetical protein